MKCESLWYEVRARGKTNVADVSLRRCPNCGEIKVLSPICSLDHLAAVMEFQAVAKDGPPAPPTQEHSPEQAPGEREGADDVA